MGQEKPQSFLNLQKDQLRLPGLISDGMVLQRDTDVRIWGWAAAGEEISIKFIDREYKTAAGRDGRWQVTLSGLRAGGPYQMEIGASRVITVKDILVGEVWVCSGQSNMEMMMERVKDQYPGETANCGNPEIRHFTVPLTYNFKGPEPGIEGGCWEAADRESIYRFSAIGYFFAKAIHERYGVPVGFIKAAVGGSPIEAWLSEEALKKFPENLERAIKFRDDEYVNAILKGDEIAVNAWYASLDKNDLGTRPEDVPWYADQYDTSQWPDMTLPAGFEKEGLADFCGVIWFRREIDVPEEMLNKPARLWLGRIVDSDRTYVNGVFVGEVTYQYPPRKYDIPPDLLRKGKNTITVRVVSNTGIGEFISDKPYYLTDGEHTIDLKGEWKYKVGAVCAPLPETTFVHWNPVGLYNGMLAPLTDYTVKGSLWYQGEANTSKPGEYYCLMKALIEDWRRKWDQPVFPFLYVQLPNYGPAQAQPSESQWAELREAQLKALEIPDTAMAVTIDVGEWNDLHPLKKKDVAGRLALAARKIAYGEDIVFSGPVYKGMKIVGNKVIIDFSGTGGGLEVKNDTQLRHFAVAGPDYKFVWAKAVIENDSVVVWNETVLKPAAVRYAWADNPTGANLINAEGLPASPFRTDS